MKSLNSNPPLLGGAQGNPDLSGSASNENSDLSESDQRRNSIY